MEKVNRASIVEKINTDQFILQIEKRTALWHSSKDEYSSKNDRRNAWIKVVKHFVPDFDQFSPADKYEIVNHVQKKWKGIRTCYAREVSKRKAEPSGSAASCRKPYVHYEILRFLENAHKNNCSSMESETKSGKEERGIDAPIEDEPRKRSKSSDEEMISVLKEKIIREHKSETNNEDRLFLLSLVSEMNKIPDQKKLSVKIQMMSMISEAQETSEQHLQAFTYSQCAHPQHMHFSSHYSPHYDTSPSHTFRHTQHTPNAEYGNCVPSGSNFNHTEHKFSVSSPQLSHNGSVNLEFCE